MDSTRERDALVPDSFRDVQWTHLPGGETSPAFVARIAALLGATTSASTARGSGPALVSAPPARTRNLRAVWIPLGLAALFVGGGWFALQRSALHRHAEAGVTVQSQPAVTEKSIAVLPFSDLSEKHDQQYFADGMAEEIIDLLSSVPGLRVIGRTSSFQFKGKNQDLRAIGSDLGVSYVVEGRACGADLQLARPPFKSAEAYDLYLRGRHAYDRFDKQGLESAAAYFNRPSNWSPLHLSQLSSLLLRKMILLSKATSSHTRVLSGRDSRHNLLFASTRNRVMPTQRCQPCTSCTTRIGRGQSARPRRRCGSTTRRFLVRR